MVRFLKSWVVLASLALNPVSSFADSVASPVSACSDPNSCLPSVIAFLEKNHKPYQQANPLKGAERYRFLADLSAELGTTLLSGPPSQPKPVPAIEEVVAERLSKKYSTAFGSDQLMAKNKLGDFVKLTVKSIDELSIAWGSGVLHKLLIEWSIRRALLQRGEVSSDPNHSDGLRGIVQ